MFGIIKDTSKLDKFYVNICLDIDKWLSEHTLSEFEQLFVTENKHPIIGLHSTIPKSLELILEGGFNMRHPEENIAGEMLNSCEVRFSSPYLNGDKINGRRYHNQYISYTNGILRNLKPIFDFFDDYGINFDKLSEKYPDNFVDFPIIISAFKNTSNKRIKVSNLIECWDPNEQCIILGVIYVKFTFDEIADMYSDKKYNIYVVKHNIKYEIEWFNDFKQNYVIVKDF